MESFTKKSKADDKYMHNMHHELYFIFIYRQLISDP